MPLINGFIFGENSADDPSPVELWSSDSARAIRNFYVFNATQLRRLQAAKALLGFNKVKLDNDTGRVYLTRRLPASYPAVADADTNPKALPYMWARSISRSEPVGASTSMSPQGASEYPAYRMSCEFMALPFFVREDDQVLAQEGPLAANAGTGARALPDEGDALRESILNTRYVSRFIEDGSLTLSIRQGMMKFVNPGVGKNGEPKDFVLPQGLLFNQLRATVRYIWHEVPQDAVPTQAIANAVNTVNGEEFDGFQAGTLLFKTLGQRLMQAPFGGQRLWEMTYVMSYVPNPQTYVVTGQPRLHLGHNAILRSRADLPGGVGNPLNSLAYERVVDVTSSRPPYQTSSFPALFRPDP